MGRRRAQDQEALELVPEDKNRDIGSFLLYHYGDPTEKDFPLDTLGRRVWKRVTPEQVNDLVALLASWRHGTSADGKPAVARKPLTPADPPERGTRR